MNLFVFIVLEVQHHWPSLFEACVSLEENKILSFALRAAVRNELYWQSGYDFTSTDTFDDSACSEPSDGQIELRMALHTHGFPWLDPGKSSDGAS